MKLPSRAAPLAALVLLLGAPAPAHAYLDPGSGSFVFQMIAGVLVGAAYSLRASLRRLLGLSRGEDEEEEDGEDGEDGEDEAPPAEEDRGPR